MELYDGIDEMPVVRYHKFTQLMVLASGVGNDIDAIRSKLFGIKQMLDDQEPEKAKVEVLNLYQTFAFIDKTVDPSSMAMACLIKSIDGVEQDDINGDKLQRLAEQLDKWVTKKERDDITDAVKKKIEGELAYYYPDHTDNDGEGLALMKRMLVRRLERIINDEDLDKKDAEIERICKRMRERRKVTNYLAYERDSDVAFEQGCLAITGELNKDAKLMTVMEYHAAMHLLEERVKEMEKSKTKK